MPQQVPGLDFSPDAKKALINFQGLYEKIMGIPASGRNAYQEWLAGRWQEAAANWGFNTSADLNRTARMSADGRGQLATPTEVYNPETGKTETVNVLQWTTDPAVTGEGFEEYLLRLFCQGSFSDHLYANEDAGTLQIFQLESYVHRLPAQQS